MPLFRSKKVRPSKQRKKKSNETIAPVEMFVMRLHTFIKLYGGQRHPRLESYEQLIERGELINTKYTPPKSTIIYISHEHTGSTHPDPHGNHIYHLILLLERLKNGEIPRTDMEFFHTLIYKKTYTFFHIVLSNSVC